MKKLSLPLQLLGIIAFVLLIGTYLPLFVVQYFYTFSSLIKELLSFLLPAIVFTFITSGVLALKKNAPIILSILLACIIISNAAVAFFAYFMGSWLLPLIVPTIGNIHIITPSDMQPLFKLNLPQIVSSEHAMIAALGMGIVLSFFKVPHVEQGIIHIKKFLDTFLHKIFIPIVPVYILGFLLELHVNGNITTLFSYYGKTFALIFILHVIALLAIYYLAAGFNFKKASIYIENSLPSYITAFGCMSSTATIPVTIACGEKNMNNKPLAEMATPILANVHLLGDAISTPILALVTMYVFTGMLPHPFTYALFVIYFCMSMLAVSGIPGGGIIVMQPILQSILGFTPDMLSIITTLYILQDSLGTGANSMGDGALIIIVNNILKRFKLV